MADGPKQGPRDESAAEEQPRAGADADGADSVPEPPRRRGRPRGPRRIKFKRWLFSEELFGELGVSARSQALVCRELKRRPDGVWMALIDAVPEGFFEARWVVVPSAVILPRTTSSDS